MQPTTPWATVAPGAAGQKCVHRAALVGFHMAERQPSKRIQRDHLGDRIGNHREQAPHAGVEQHRLVTRDEILVEAEVHLGHVGIDLVDAIGHLG